MTGQPGNKPLTLVAEYPPSVIAPGRPSVRTTFQMKALIPRRPPVEEIRPRARSIILDWIRQKFPERLPPEAESGESFEIEIPTQKLSCVGLERGGIWSIRLEQPDIPFNNHPAVPGRSWISELSLAKEDDKTWFATRVSCASLQFANQPINLTRPRVVRDIAGKLGLFDIRQIDSPWRITEVEELESFAELLVNPKRTLPIYLLSEIDPRRRAGGQPEYTIQPDSLFYECLAVAYVVAMSFEMGFAWSKQVGREWSAYDGAVRTFNAGMEVTDSPFAHPKATPNKISSWITDGLRGERGFQNYLAQQAILNSVRRKVSFAPCLLFADARVRQAEFDSAEDANEDRQAEHLKSQISSLQIKVDELEKECEGFSDDAVGASRDMRFFQQENDRFRHRIALLEAQLQAKYGEEWKQPEPEAPTSCDEVSDWIDEAFVGKLLLHSRARNALKKADYQDIALICSALRLLAYEYRGMRINGDQEGVGFENRAKTLGLTFSGSISKERAGAEGDLYFVNYPQGTQQKRFLEFHLAKGNSRESRHCLRIYFFWDEEVSQVVVGWLPSHLENQLT